MDYIIGAVVGTVLTLTIGFWWMIAICVVILVIAYIIDEGSLRA